MMNQTEMLGTFLLVLLSFPSSEDFAFVLCL